MFGSILFTFSLIVALVIGYLNFRDLGDVSQMLISVKRENMIRFIRNEYRLLTIGLEATRRFSIAWSWEAILSGGN